MRILLVRHGESEGNVNRNVYFDKPDHAIALSDLGVQQALGCGIRLGDSGYRPHRVWVSPYTRTRQTAEGIIRGAGWHDIDVRESIHLVEQQFGLFDGHAEDALPLLFPNEHAHYQKAQDFEGRFWARMPLGESRFDVCQRVHQFFGTIQRDAEKHGIDDIVVVCHGVTIRAFIMMWTHQPWEWMESDLNPANCEVRELIDASYTGRVEAPSLLIRNR